MKLVDTFIILCFFESINLLDYNYAFFYIILAKDVKNNGGQNCTLVQMSKLKFENYLKLYDR